MTPGPQQPLVAVISTGGTIASRRQADGASAPSMTGEGVLAALPGQAVPVRVVELMSKDSASLTLADMQAISREVWTQNADPAITGVVVLHGTDAMEETALLLQVQHAPLAKPVIVTGAQFTLDQPQADGPANLAAALAAASEPAHARRGVLVAFGGRLLPAWGLHKQATDRIDAFGQVSPIENPAGPSLTGDVSGVRVDIAAIYPGCDATHMDASLAAGAAGIVLAALGSGNANPLIVAAVRRCRCAGVPVVVSSRVPEGRLDPGYGGGGGGHDLTVAGAIHSRILRPGQARILLTALIASQADPQTRAEAFGGTA